jgi:hypothetical protein
MEASDVCDSSEIVTDPALQPQPMQWCPDPSECDVLSSQQCTDLSNNPLRACLNDPTRSCHLVALPAGQTLAPSADEIRRLQNWFVLGDPMPLPYKDHLDNRLGLPELRMIQAWIADLEVCPL